VAGGWRLGAGRALQRQKRERSGERAREEFSLLKCMPRSGGRREGRKEGRREGKQNGRKR